MIPRARKKMTTLCNITMKKVIINDIRYELNEEEKTASIVRNENRHLSGEIVIPEQIVIEGQRYSVTSIGKAAFHHSLKVSSILIPNGVKEIGRYAFYGCTSLISTIIPNSVTKIGVCAFTDCSSLTSIDISKSVKEISSTIFRNCSSLTDVKIPDSVTKIDSSAFEGCSSLRSINIPNSVKEIARDAFKECISLKSINIPDSVTQISYSAFEGCSSLTSINIPCNIVTIEGNVFSCCSSLKHINVSPQNRKYDSRDNCNAIIETANNRLIVGCQDTIIPDSVTEISHSAFEGCSSLTSIDIPCNIVSIKSNVFSCCSSLKHINVSPQNRKYDSRNNCNAIIETANNSLIVGCQNTIIPDSVTEISSSAFEGCSSFTSIKIPESITKICYSAFKECSSITSIDIPCSVVEISSSAFSYCSSLKHINVSPNNLKYDSRDSCNAIIETANNRLIIGCQNTIIPNSVTEIASFAFSDCSSLNSINISNSVTKIGMYAFKGCLSLESINISDSVTEICVSAFEGCSSLRSISIPNSVKEIAREAFKDCSSLKSVNIPNSITKIGSSAFENCSSLTSIDIPDSVTQIGKRAFLGCSSLETISIPNRVTKIDQDMFDLCFQLKTVNISTTTKYICSCAFAGCEAISRIDFKDAFVCCCNKYSAFNQQFIYGTDEQIMGKCLIKANTKICGEYAVSQGIIGVGRKAFLDCKDITSVALPDSIRYIGTSAFENCTNLLSINIPNGVELIEKEAFKGCSSLINIAFPDDVKDRDGAVIRFPGVIAECKKLQIIHLPKQFCLDNYAFDGLEELHTITIPNGVNCIPRYSFRECKKIKYLALPDSIEDIQDGAFYHCESLEEITLPTNISKIPNWCFCGCFNLKNLSIPNNVKEIESNSIVFCHQLKYLIIPEGVTKLGQCAINSCKNLMSITLPRSLNELDVDALHNLPSLKEICIPKGQKARFLQMGIQQFEDLLVERDNEEITILLNLAKAYEKGIGVIQNIAQSALYYTQAAEKGCAESAYHLGELYEKGEGLPLDYQQAIVWYTKAVALYHPLAEQRKKHCEKVVHEEEQRLFEQHKPPKSHQNQLQSSIQTAKYLFFDTETTGLPPRDLEDSSYDQIDVWPRLVQIGWIVTDANGNIIKRRGEIIRPEGFIIPKGASDVHGITTEKAMQIGVPIGKVLREIYDDMLHVKLLVAHNFGFDHKILGAEFYRKNIDTNIIDDKEHICTMLSTTNYCELLPIRFGEYKWPKLEELHHKLFGCTFSDAHDALADVEATKKCFFELKKKGIL